MSRRKIDQNPWDIGLGVIGTCFLDVLSLVSGRDGLESTSLWCPVDEKPVPHKTKEHQSHKQGDTTSEQQGFGCLGGLLFI